MTTVRKGSMTAERQSGTSSPPGGRDLLTRFPRFRRLLLSRAFQPAAILFTTTFFTLAVITGLAGTQAGNRNFGIVFVWIIWWAVLMLLLVPFLGRFWCTVCPIPAPGEWLQRRSIVERRPDPGKSTRRVWPRRFRNMWLQNAGFLTVALFSAVILTKPSVTAAVLLGLTGIAVGVSLVFEKRAFCRYLCPVGGFIGLYSMMAPTELRVRDPEVCAAHRSKDCITGNDRGYGCPGMVYPGKLDRNLDCGLCTECLKTCTMDNVVLNLRPPGKDLLVETPRVRLDEAFKALIMLGCALAYPAILFGPWPTIKGWAALDSIAGWAVYAAGFIAFNLAIVPAGLWLAAASSRRRSDSRRTTLETFVAFSYAVVPMGLAAWMAFSIGFALTNGSYALATISDPFGWGWNLFGTRDAGWSPMLDAVTPVIQAFVLLGGLTFSVRTAYRIGYRHTGSVERAVRATSPVAAFLLGTTVALLWLYLG